MNMRFMRWKSTVSWFTENKVKLSAAFILLMLLIELKGNISDVLFKKHDFRWQWTWSLQDTALFKYNENLSLIIVPVSSHKAAIIVHSVRGSLYLTFYCCCCCQLYWMYQLSVSLTQQCQLVEVSPVIPSHECCGQYLWIFVSHHAVNLHHWLIENEEVWL